MPLPRHPVDVTWTAQRPRARAPSILSAEVVEEHDPRRRHADRLHHMIIGLRVGFAKPDRWRTGISRGNGRARRHRLARNARHGPDWCWRTHRAAGVVPRAASSGAIPGISPVKIAFQPSRNCASVMPMPSEARRLSKNAASLISPRLVTLPGLVGRQTADEIGGLAAGVAGPARHHLVEVDIEHDAAEIEQQHVGGVGRGAANSWQSFTKLGRARATAQGTDFTPNPALKPVRKLC